LLLDAVLETVRGIRSSQSKCLEARLASSKNMAEALLPVVDVGKAIAAAPVGRYGAHALFPMNVLPGPRANAGPVFLCRALVNSVDGRPRSVLTAHQPSSRTLASAW
jgi:hypothetical protein